MSTEITNDKGELDANHLVSKLQLLNTRLDDLQTEAKNANVLPTVTQTGAFFWKHEEFNPEKVEKLGQNAYEQAQVLAELYDIQMQAMQLSVGSFDALKAVNKELTKAMSIGFSESGEQNQALFKKTQEQIKRVAKFAKNYSDNLEELKKELSKEFENYQSEVQDNIRKGINNLEMKLAGFVETSDVDRQIETALKNYIKKDYFDETKNTLEQNLQSEINKIEERVAINLDSQMSELKTKLEDFVKINQFEEKINEQILKERESITKKIEEKKYIIKDDFENAKNTLEQNLQSEITKIEERVAIVDEKKNSKQKNNVQIIVGLVLGAVGTILALVSILII